MEPQRGLLELATAGALLPRRRVRRPGRDGGYIWGNYFPHWKAWTSFEEIFGPTIAQVQRFTSRPLLVAESASTKVGGDKAAWIADTFAALSRHPEITGFVWFNQIKETDWRIQSWAAARAAFRQGVAGRRYAAPERSIISGER